LLAVNFEKYCGTRPKSVNIATTSRKLKMLKGRDLLELVASMPGRTKQEIAIAAGYTKKTGRANLVDYYEAYIDAQGLEVGETPAKGKPTSAVLHRQKAGGVAIGKSWWEAIGVDMEDEIDIAIDRDSDEAQVTGPRIILSKRAAKFAASPYAVEQNEGRVLVENGSHR
jgi:hypothetical protein